jgi:hypothetical protein
MYSQEIVVVDSAAVGELVQCNGKASTEERVLDDLYDGKVFLRTRVLQVASDFKVTKRIKHGI